VDYIRGFFVYLRPQSVMEKLKVIN